MIQKIIIYKCPYCNNTYNLEQEAINCLNNHPIIFAIESYVADHDCWGSSTGRWVLTDKLFKTYESALEYTKNTKVLRIIIKELL